MLRFLNEISNVKPSDRQLAWYDTEYYGFVHFGVNTFTGKEWGDGSESPDLFDPVDLDCDQWARTFRDAGMKGMILTAKHHDGFCLWPSKYTEHSVKNSPCGKDVVLEASQACRRWGLKFGVYLSPWDRNSALYGTEEYNDYYCSQLEELLTGYGEIFCVWFDNACGEGPNGKKQIYDFPRYIEMVRQLQPNAVIFNDFGPDVRWCGNEEGHVRMSEWSTVPSELCKYSDIQTGPGPLCNEGDLTFLYNTAEQIGDWSVIKYSKGLTFTPAEVDMSIRPGWFWHEEEAPHSLERLFRTYIASVGGNCCLNLNVPPDRTGRLDERDVHRLKELRSKIDTSFQKQIPCSIVKDQGSAPSQPCWKLSFDQPITDLHYLVLREDISKGQRIESFTLGVQYGENMLFPLFQGTTVGNRKICEIRLPVQEGHPAPPKTDLILKVTAGRGEVILKEISLW